MLSRLIKDFNDANFQLLNERLDTNIKVKQIRSDIDMENISASESMIHYQLLFDGSEQQKFETPGINNINIILDFIFNIANKNADRYEEIIDRYLWGLVRIIQDSTYYNDDISQSLRIRQIVSCSMSNLNRFEEMYFKPSLNVTMSVIDDKRLSKRFLQTKNVN